MLQAAYLALKQCLKQAFNAKYAACKPFVGVCLQ